MKKNDWILLVTVSLYSFLFYEQTAGVNFLLFNIGVIVMLTIKTLDLWSAQTRRIVVAGCLVSAGCVAWYGTTLAVIANVISLSLLSAFTADPKASVIFSLASSFYSYVSAPVYMLLDRAARKQRSPQTALSATLKKAGLIVLPVLITLLFFFMYRASNPLFNDLAGNLKIDLVSGKWLLFTAGGLILCYGFFYHRKIAGLQNLDNGAADLMPGAGKEAMLFGKHIAIQDELFSGKVLFILLNLLLLVVNALDVNFLFLGGALPEGVTYSQFVHQGTEALIASIIIAIAVILFYFRGELNFHSGSRIIRLLVYCWIIQNAFMLVSTAMRTNMYIEEYGLTYKRIGVFVYLGLTLAGLATTFIKVMSKKSNHYLFRVNSWICYAVLVLSCIFNWDLIITRYNMRRPDHSEKQYLLKLSYTNLPELIASESRPVAFPERTAPEKDSVTRAEAGIFHRDLSSKLYYFLDSREQLGWRSWYYDNTRIYEQIMALKAGERMRNIDLYKSGVSSLEALKVLPDLQELGLSFNKIHDVREVAYFTSLRRLDLSFNRLSGLRGIETLTKLEYLNLDGNRIYDYSPLHQLTQLKELIADYSITAHQLGLLRQALPNTTIIKR